MPAERTDALAIEGRIEVNETGRRVVVRIPMAVDDAVSLQQLLTELSQR